MPSIDPVQNPVGFYVMFGVVVLIVVLLAAGSVFWLISFVRSVRGRVDPAATAVSHKFDAVEAKQRRLDEQLKEIRARKPPPPPD